MHKRKRHFSQQEKQVIASMLESGKTNVEISQKLNRAVTSVSVYVRNRFGGNPSYLKKKTKHAHLHEKVLKYFFNHSFEDTAKYFELTQSELKSCMTCAYRQPHLKYLRKDDRINHRRFWTEKEIITMLRMCGIFSRHKIAEVLDRGNERVIKEKLNKLGVASRNINGLNLAQFRNGFGVDCVKFVRGNAGPSGGRGQFFFKIVLWVDVEKMIDRGEIETFNFYEKLIKTMASFQRWIWGGGDVRRKVLNMIRKVEL